MSEVEKRKWVRSFDVNIPSHGFIDPLIEFDLPRDAKNIVGIRIESDEIAVCYNRGFIGIELSNVEVVPAKTSVQMFFFSDNADEKFLNLGIFKNETAKMRISCADAGTYPFLTYNIRIILLFEK